MTNFFGQVGHLEAIDFDANNDPMLDTFGCGPKPLLVLVYDTGYKQSASLPVQLNIGEIFVEQGQRKVFICAIDGTYGNGQAAGTPDMAKFIASIKKSGLPTTVTAGVEFVPASPSIYIYYKKAWTVYNGKTDLESLRNIIRSYPDPFDWNLPNPG